MHKTLTSEKHPIKLWLPELDPQTLQQAKNLANLPFLVGHVAIMADAHVGYGMPIGGVAATQGVILPNAVGVDIGCGVCAVETSLDELDRRELSDILRDIRRVVPLGFKHHPQPRPAELMPQLSTSQTAAAMPVVEQEFASGRQQLGTLGGGNHFIELQKSVRGRIWLMVHSGSRNIGFQVANHYQKKAVAHNRKHGQRVPAKWELDYLALDSREGSSYLAEMTYCVAFAKANRRVMMQAIMAVLADHCPGTSFQPPIDIAHNYAAQEEHFGRLVMVHRKGATRAGKGEPGIIPGSQGSVSYIISGRGNPESLLSCSHGAGRVLGRNQARKQLDLQKEIARLEQQGVIHSLRSKKDLDEAAGAYKDIHQVIGNQSDLVEIRETLHPLAVIKG